MPRVFTRDFAHRARMFRRLASRKKLDADDVHDLRVTTRRLRVSIALLRHASIDADTSRARKKLRELGRLLGECRMLDVAIGDARHYRASTAQLEQRRDRAYATLRHALSSSRVERLATALHRIEKAAKRADVAGISGRIERIQQRIARRVARPPRTARARHELRIEMKKARYVIEAFGREAPAVRRLQDLLGREHDLAVLRSVSGRIPRAARDERATITRAQRAIAPALRSALKHLRAIRRGLGG